MGVELSRNSLYLRLRSEMGTSSDCSLLFREAGLLKLELVALSWSWVLTRELLFIKISISNSNKLHNLFYKGLSSDSISVCVLELPRRCCVR